MKIYVNGRFLCQHRTGVERYAYELCKALRKCGLEFTLVCPNRPIMDEYDVTDFDIVRYGIGSSHIWEQCVLPFFFLGKKDYLLLSFTGLGSIFVKQKVMTVHDLSFLYNPSWFSKAYYYYYKVMTPLAVRTSKKILTVSEFSKSEILRFYPYLKAEDIKVVYNACDAGLFSSESFATNSRCTEKYALAVSSIDPRKNLAVLLEAFADSSIGSKLYIVGNYNKVFSSQNIHETKSDNVVFLGRVSDEKLQQLYANAMCYVSSSLYEGFGLPLLEAMSCGCPVLCSDIPVYREVCGDSALYFSPTSPESIKNTFSRYCYIAEDERNTIKSKMSETLSRFSWTTSAKRLISILAETK